VFAAYGVSILGTPRVVGTNHLSLTLVANEARIDAIGFGMAERLSDLVGSERTFDVAFHLEENERRQQRGPGPVPIQARLVDLRLAQ
jgi:hypothetical protein